MGKSAIVMCCAVTMLFAVSCSSSSKTTAPSTATRPVTGSVAPPATTSTVRPAAATTTTTTAPTLAGTYTVTGPVFVQKCNLGLGGPNDVMYVSGNALTISDSAGLITGVLAPQGNRAAVVAEQPGNYSQHTLAFTVANGGATFTATDADLTKLGTCSSTFSGQRTAMTAEPPTTTTIDVATSRCSPAQIKAALGLDDEFQGITSCTATSATVMFGTQGMNLVGQMQWSDSTGQWSFVAGTVVCRVNGQPMSGPLGCPDNGH